MAATFIWEESNGAGETITTTTTVNWKSVDDNAGTAYTAAPITDGTNSFEKWQAGKVSGTFNNVLAGLHAHTLTAFGTGLTLKGAPAMTVDGDRLAYATPSQTTNANLTLDMTTAISIGSGAAVWFGPTGASAAGKAASTSTDPSWTNYLTTQLQTSGASPGDTATVTLTLQYDEN